jgi:hypothetical protein
MVSLTEHEQTVMDFLKKEPVHESMSIMTWCAGHNFSPSVVRKLIGKRVLAKRSRGCFTMETPSAVSTVSSKKKKTKFHGAWQKFDSLEKRLKNLQTILAERGLVQSEPVSTEPVLAEPQVEFTSSGSTPTDPQADPISISVSLEPISNPVSWIPVPSKPTGPILSDVHKSLTFDELLERIEKTEASLEKARISEAEYNEYVNDVTEQFIERVSRLKRMRIS